jgi:hypothetical protein
MPSGGTLRRVALVRRNVLEELSASIISVTIIGDLGTTLAVTSNRRTLRGNSNQYFTDFFMLMMEALLFFETSILTRVTRRNNREDGIRHN